MGLNLPPVLVIIFTILVPLVIGFVLGILVHNYIVNQNLNDARNNAEGIIDNAKKEAATLKKELLLNSKEENSRYRSKIEDELHSRQVVIADQEKRLNTREEKLDHRDTLIEKKENQLSQQSINLENQRQKVTK